MKKKTWALILVYAFSLYIAYSWEKLAVIRKPVEQVLDPTLGVLVSWNTWIGFVIIVALTSLILTLAQKYLSDQEALRELRKEQKLLQEEMKKYKEHPEKMMELQKKQFEIFPKTFNLTMMPMLYTAIPIILLFRWFAGILHPIFGGWWILYYLIGSMIFSSIFRKLFKVV